MDAIPTILSFVLEEKPHGFPGETKKGFSPASHPGVLAIEPQLLAMNQDLMHLGLGADSIRFCLQF